MFFLILFGFYHVFLTGRTAAKKQHTVSTIQFESLLTKKIHIIQIQNVTIPFSDYARTEGQRD